MRLPKRGAKKKSGCTNSRRKSRRWKDNRRNLSYALGDPTAYEPGGRAVSINRELAAVTADLARLTNKWETVTATV